jgi:hypothetical protein
MYLECRLGKLSLAISRGGSPPPEGRASLCWMIVINMKVLIATMGDTFEDCRWQNGLARSRAG